MIEKYGRKFASRAELSRFESFKHWYQQPAPFTRQDRVRSSEQTAAVMFRECRSMFIVDSIDSQLTCVWFS